MSERRSLQGAAADAERSNLPKRLKQLDDLLRGKGIDLADLESARVKAVKFWQAMHKDTDGDAVLTDLAGITISPAWEEGPAWPVIQPGPKVEAPKVRLPLKPKKRGGGAWRTAVVLPDIQGGFWRDPDTGELVPTHDEAALEVAIQIIMAVDPDDVVMHGDNLDLPEFSRYRKLPTFARTTQATIDWGTLLCARLRAAAPRARLVWLAGNHEERLPHYIIDNAVAAFGIKRPGDKWPVLSVPSLLRFDESGVEFVPGYPANEFWLNDRLRVIHGHKVNSRGTTTTRYLEDERASVLYGHVHRREWSERTRRTRNGPRNTLAASFGCLCRLTGEVPGAHAGYDLDGRPVDSTSDWQQGMGVVEYEPGEGRFTIEPIAINDGVGRYRGVEYTAPVVH